MTPLQVAANGAEISAALAGAALAWRRPAHRPAAVALAALVALVLLGLPLRAGLGPPSAEPIEGAARALVFLDGARKLALPAVVPGLAFAVCGSRPRRALLVLAAAWFFASVALAVLYPSPMVRGDGLRRVYLMADLVALSATAVAFGLWARLRRSPSSAHVVALALAFFDLAVLLNPLGPWRAGLFGVPFDSVQVTILVGFAALTFYQGVLWRFSTPSA